MIGKGRFKDLYSFNSGSIRWIPKGGELLESIGQRVIRVHFKKDPADDKYVSTEDQVIIKSIHSYDPKTMTYKIDYVVPGKDGAADEEKTDTIIPEGFTTDIIGAGMQDEMYRFIPGYIHLNVISQDLFFTRLQELWNTRKTMGRDELYEIDRDKDQGRTLKYTRNIQAVTMVDSVLCSFRIVKLKIRRDNAGIWRLTITDDLGNSFNMPVSPGQESYTLKDIGEVKIIDIQDEKGEEEKEDSN